MNTEIYNSIFQRKSFHLFRDAESISEIEMKEIEEVCRNAAALNQEIHTEIKIVKAEETTCKRGEEYCILFYSEHKEGYLRNIGYLGEQIDLRLTAMDIGTLWFGIGKPIRNNSDLEYVIMIAIAKMPHDKFRKDMYKAKRKPIQEIWQGEEYPFSNTLRFTPSACNTQPWIIQHTDDSLSIYRYEKPGKRGIMPIDKVSYYNQIDIGIFLLFLEVLLEKEGYCYARDLFFDDGDMNREETLTAVYKVKHA